MTTRPVVNAPVGGSTNIAPAAPRPPSEPVTTSNPPVVTGSNGSGAGAGAGDVTEVVRPGPAASMKDRFCPWYEPWHMHDKYVIDRCKGPPLGIAERRRVLARGEEIHPPGSYEIQKKLYEQALQEDVEELMRRAGRTEL